MKITRKQIADKLIGYFENRTTLPQLVDWAEETIREGEFIEDNGNHVSRDVVAQLGVADVKAFGLGWEDHKEMLRKLGYDARVVVQPQS